MAASTPDAGTWSSDLLLPRSIDSYVITDVPVCAPHDRVVDVRESLIGRCYESIDDVAVCEDGALGRLVGLIPMEAVLSAISPILRTGPFVHLRPFDRPDAARRHLPSGPKTPSVGPLCRWDHGQERVTARELGQAPSRWRRRTRRGPRHG
ncbi:hypothetical protein E7Z54_06150 [Nocardioides sp.]|nr:hypothetical protein E7Z54_06150 [Nocardioides sp.]